MENKKCSDCGEVKPLNEFYLSKRDGCCSRCKDCDKKRNQEYREKNKEYFIKKKAEYYQENKENQNEKYRENKKKAMERAGLNINYHTIHDLIRRNKPKPELCEICYQDKSLELASIGHTYSMDPLEWKWLCRDCHVKYDRSKSESQDEQWLREMKGVKYFSRWYGSEVARKGRAVVQKLIAKFLEILRYIDTNWDSITTRYLEERIARYEEARK